MGFAADFTAIDFETASRRSDSACQLGAVRVREGRLTESAVWFIRPEPLYFSPSHIRIHGIRPEQVRNEPAFGEIWGEVSEWLAGDCLVAHNASFDMGVLLACLRKSRSSIPEFHYTCTRAIARRAWPQRRRYGLKPLSEWLGVEFQHHDALEDSVACAKVLIAAGIARNAESLDDLESRLRLKRGRAGDWGMSGPTQTSSRARTSRKGREHSTRSGLAGKHAVTEPKQAYDVTPEEPTLDIQRLLVRAEFIRPLRGQRILFAGKLRRLNSTEARQLATRSGGHCDNSLSDGTDIMVVGTGDRNSRSMEETLHAGEAMKKTGKQIRIVNEDEFLSLVTAST